MNESSIPRSFCVGYPWDYDITTTNNTKSAEGYEVITSAHGKGPCYSQSFALGPGESYDWEQSLMHSPGDEAVTKIRIRIRVYPLDSKEQSKRRQYLELMAEWAAG